MTPRNLQVYEVLQCWLASRRYPPTVRELADACDFRAYSAAYYHLRWLKAAGLVGWLPGRRRTLWVA